MERNYLKVLFTFVVAALFLMGCELILEKTLLQSPQSEKINFKSSPFELSSEHHGKTSNPAAFEDFIKVLKDKKARNGVVLVIDSKGNHHSLRTKK